MIRALAYLVAIVIGSVAALFSQGRMDQLRLAAPSILPAWSDRIAPDAGLGRGAADLAGLAGSLPLTLGWRALMPDAGGLRWQLHLTGPGIDLTAAMTLFFNLEEARVDALTGTVDLAQLGGIAFGLDGILEFSGLDMMVSDLRAEPRPSGTVHADWRGARYKGTDLGAGTVDGALDPLLSWRAKIDLSGGAADVQAGLAGRAPGRRVGVEVNISDDAALPEPWRRLLAIAGEKRQDGWLIRQTLTLPAAPG